MIHLDTSFLVDLLREASRGKAGPAGQLLDSLAEESLGISVFVACELSAGVELARNPAAERSKVKALLGSLWMEHPDERFPAAYGKLLAQMQRAGDVISTMDLLIATSARLADAELVTRNLRDVQRIPGLDVRSY